MEEEGVLYGLAEAQDSRECSKADYMYLLYLQGWEAESRDRDRDRERERAKADKSLAVGLLFIIIRVSNSKSVLTMAGWYSHTMTDL